LHTPKTTLLSRLAKLRELPSLLGRRRLPRGRGQGWGLNACEPLICNRGIKHIMISRRPNLRCDL
jgi:hypothetical protein